MTFKRPNYPNNMMKEVDYSGWDCHRHTSVLSFDWGPFITEITLWLLHVKTHRIHKLTGIVVYPTLFYT